LCCREHRSLQNHDQQPTGEAEEEDDDADMGAVEDEYEEASEDVTTNGHGMTKKERNRKRAWKAKQSAARTPAPETQIPPALMASGKHMDIVSSVAVH
jgi:hypothetical protein